MVTAAITADVDVARQLGLGVGNDQVVALRIGERVIGYLAPDDYETFRRAQELTLPSLAELRGHLVHEASRPPGYLSTQTQDSIRFHFDRLFADDVVD